MSSDGFDKLDKEFATGNTRRQFLKAVGAGTAGGLLALFRGRSTQGDTRSSNNTDNTLIFGASGVQLLGDGVIQRDTFSTQGRHGAERSSVFDQGMGIPNSAN